jgi:hypothetical protein
MFLMTDAPTVTIDGNAYALSDLSTAAKGQLASLQVTDQEIVRVQQQLAILQTARNAYAKALQAELPSLEDQAFGNLSN